MQEYFSDLEEVCTPYLYPVAALFAACFGLHVIQEFRPMGLGRLQGSKTVIVASRVDASQGRL